MPVINTMFLVAMSIILLLAPAGVSSLYLKTAESRRLSRPEKLGFQVVWVIAVLAAIGLILVDEDQFSAVLTAVYLVICFWSTVISGIVLDIDPAAST